MIIGITGTIGAGKGAVVEYLKEKRGFVHFSVRDFIVNEIKKRGLEASRDNMVEVANDLRATHGSSFITEELYKEAANSDSDAIIESIRTLGEVAFLKEKPGFVLLAVDAEPKFRYERIRARKSSTDDVSFEKFLEDEQREMQSTDPNKQNISGCMKEANHTIYNNGDFEDLYKQIEKVVGQLLN